MRLTRYGYTPMGTFGEIELPNGARLQTVELPWRGNEQSVSCIPSGTYALRKRLSGVVKRSSGGKYSQGWEVTSVPGRTYIMVHVANTIDDLEGCIGVGAALGFVAGKWAVTSSAVAFDEFMDALRGQNEWLLEIVDYVPEYP